VLCVCLVQSFCRLERHCANWAIQQQWWTLFLWPHVLTPSTGGLAPAVFTRSTGTTRGASARPLRHARKRARTWDLSFCAPKSLQQTPTAHTPCPLGPSHLHCVAKVPGGDHSCPCKREEGTDPLSRVEEVGPSLVVASFPQGVLFSAHCTCFGGATPHHSTHTNYFGSVLPLCLSDMRCPDTERRKLCACVNGVVAHACALKMQVLEPSARAFVVWIALRLCCARARGGRGAV